MINHSSCKFGVCAASVAALIALGASSTDAALTYVQFQSDSPNGLVSGSIDGVPFVDLPLAMEWEIEDTTADIATDSSFGNFPAGTLLDNRGLALDPAFEKTVARN